jgi:hypothetical protein
VRTEEFLDRLNAEADLHGQQRVSARTLEEWAYEDLVTGPTQINGGWDRSEESYAEAQKVMEYRRRGFKRVTAIKAQWWLEGENYPVHKVREAVIHEYKRARNLALRRVSSAHGIRRDVDLTEYRRLALRRQLGPLDPLLKDAGFDFGAAVVIAFYELARFGEQVSPIDKNTEPLAAALSSVALPNGLHVLAGLLEIEDDHPLSAVYAMRQLTNVQFEECRQWIGFLPTGLILGQAFFEVYKSDGGAKYRAFTAAINSWSKWPWCIATFALVANIYYHRQMQVVNGY